MSSHPVIPESSSTVSVSIIDSTARFSGIPSTTFIGPPVIGFETFSCAAYAFLIEHNDPTSPASLPERLIFDLGPSPDWRDSLPKGVVERVHAWIENGAEIEISKHVKDVLEEGGVVLTARDKLIWSHPHWDHIGRPSLFPPEVPLIVGPGVKQSMFPGWPENPSAGFKSDDLRGREVLEVEFNSGLSIGGLQAIDYFGDGSIYLLNAPGHCVGHVNALARVSNNPDRFILMGADSFHHASQLRPNAGMILPKEVDIAMSQGPSFQCPGEAFHRVYPTLGNHQNDQYTSFCSSIDPGTTPFLTISQNNDGTTVATDIFEARETLKNLEAFDADKRVFVVSAHDATLLQILEFFPKTANEWQQKGWKEKSQWLFLKDFRKTIQAVK